MSAEWFSGLVHFALHPWRQGDQFWLRPSAQMGLAGSKSLSGNIAKTVFATGLGKELLHVGGDWVWRDKVGF